MRRTVIHRAGIRNPSQTRRFDDVRATSAFSALATRTRTCREVGFVPKQTKAPRLAWIPAGEKHWHGATATIGMTHIAIAEALEGKTVDWMEKVSDEQYGT